MNNRARTLFALTALALTGLALTAAAKEIPAQLPDPDGQAPDATKPVKVYILAGQSNMVGMGNISGARCRYTGIYLTADPGAPKGLMAVGRAIYKIDTHGIYVAADTQADSGAAVSIYEGAYDPVTDYDKAKPVKTEQIALGNAEGSLPAVSGPHTVVARGFLDVPETGTYIVSPGFGDSAYNVMELDGEQVYRKAPGQPAVHKAAALEAAKRYPLQITYFQGGSTAFWMSRLDLVGKGDLEIVTKRDGKFPHLIDDQGEWTVRNDVYFQEARLGFKGSPLTVPTLPGQSTIGPELQFGHIMGYFHDGQVLLIKTAQGNRALAWDFRPPSSGRTDTPGAEEWEGLEYRLMIEGVRKTLDQIAQIVPNYQGQGYEIAGFAWFQGHKDGGSEAWTTEYEKNLVNLINDVRTEFKAPKLPVVVATVGFGGHHMAENYLRILNAQLAVGDPEKHPEFVGNVCAVDTRDFWREVDDSPADQGYHYHRNAETYLLVGDALGRAMVELQGGASEAGAPSSRPAGAQAVARQVNSGQLQPGQIAKARTALKPIIVDGMIPLFMGANRAVLLSEANAVKPARVTPFLRGAMFGLTEFYRQAGIDEYDWHIFGPDLKNVKWDYYSFDPQETKPKDEGGPRYRKVTYPEGMADWFAVDFDPAKAGWKTRAAAVRSVWWQAGEAGAYLLVVILRLQRPVALFVGERGASDARNL